MVTYRLVVDFEFTSPGHIQIAELRLQFGVWFQFEQSLSNRFLEIRWGGTAGFDNFLSNHLKNGKQKWWIEIESIASVIAVAYVFLFRVNITSLGLCWLIEIGEFYRNGEILGRVSGPEATLESHLTNFLFDLRFLIIIVGKALYCRRYTANSVNFNHELSLF